MSDPTPLTKDPVSLNDLKRDIEEFEYCSRRYTKHDGTYQAARADVWRTAFEWYVALDDRFAIGPESVENLQTEYEEGMRLIREKLQS